MRAVATKMFGLAIAVLAASALVAAQEPAPASTSDPRAKLKPGFRDAGVVARNLELVATLPKPEGFFDPTAPAGLPSPSVADFTVPSVL